MRKKALLRNILFLTILMMFTTIPLVAGKKLESYPVYNKNNGHSYWRVDTPMHRKDAQKYCESKNAYLVSINDADEQEFVYENVVLDESIAPYKRKVHYNYAIGGSDEEQEGIWVWADGEYVTYDNWASGRPYNNDSRNFMFIDYDDGTWLDGYGGSSYSDPFICEYNGKLEDIDNPDEPSSDSSNDYNRGYEAGKKYCQDNPEKCGISCDSGETNCSSSNGTILPSSEVECGYYNFITSSLHIPCIEIGADKFWFDFKVGTDRYSNVYLTIGNYGKTYSQVDCSKFGEDECKKYSDICEWEPGLFGMDGECKTIEK